MTKFRMQCNECEHTYEIEKKAIHCPECGHEYSTALDGGRAKGRTFKAEGEPGEPLNLSDEDKQALRQMSQGLNRALGSGPQTITLELPPRFYWDHVSRGFPAGEVVKVLSRAVRVRLTKAEYDEMLSDARFHVENAPHWDAGLEGLVASARATVRRLEKADTPW